MSISPDTMVSGDSENTHTENERKHLEYNSYIILIYAPWLKSTRVVGSVYYSGHAQSRQDLRKRLSTGLPCRVRPRRTTAVIKHLSRECVIRGSRFLVCATETEGVDIIVEGVRMMVLG